MANIITAGNSTNGGTSVTTDTSGTLNIVTGSGSGSTAIAVDTSQSTTLNSAASTAPFIAKINGTEVARINTIGDFLVGVSTSPISGGKGVVVNAATAAGVGVVQMSNTNASGKAWTLGNDGNGNFVVINNSGAGAYVAYGGTSWTANSDERLKDIIEPISDAANKVSTLRAVIGKYKTDEEGKRRSFLIAQDVQAVLPEAVDTTYPEKLGVQYTEVIPLLVAAIQELKAELDAVKAKVGV